MQPGRVLTSVEKKARALVEMSLSSDSRMHMAMRAMWPLTYGGISEALVYYARL